MRYTEILKQNALCIPEILLPNSKTDLSRWAVIACDQFTQDRDYWKQVAAYVGDKPSTLHIILPEVYLEDNDRAERLTAIRKTMRTYLGTSPAGESAKTDKSSNTTSDYTTGIFAPPVHGFIYIERKTAYGRTRKGLIAAIDLDAYEWKSDSKALIRATEATIVERIPPRMEIRRGAPLESPHIMLLVNDPGKSLIEKIGERVRAGVPLYTAPLMEDAGSVSGWEVSSGDDLTSVAEAVQNLAKAGTAPDGSCFLFAVGDGNHSLATAKAVWDEFKKNHASDISEGKIDVENHPARYALVELVNLYDEGLTFEPIHRVLFGTDTETVSAYLSKKLGGSIRHASSKEELEKVTGAKNETRFGFVSQSGLTYLDSPDPALAVSRLQPALDSFLAENPAVKIDYIHGSDEVFRLGNKPGTVSILLPPVEKDSFFTTIAAGGPLPRKSFSMGEASEKRFYLECRALFTGDC